MKMQDKLGTILFRKSSFEGVSNKKKFAQAFFNSFLKKVWIYNVHSVQNAKALSLKVVFCCSFVQKNKYLIE